MSHPVSESARERLHQSYRLMRQSEELMKQAQARLDRVHARMTAQPMKTLSQSKLTG
jgi:hypothetical protein